MTPPGPPDDRDTERAAAVAATAARIQRSSGALVRWVDPPPALLWVGVSALVVIAALLIAILTVLVFAPPYVLVRGG